MSCRGLHQPVDTVNRWVYRGLLCGLTLELLALATWVGGLIVLIGAVIPAVFNTLGGQDSGGFLLTRAFEGYNRLVVVAMALLVAIAVCRQWSGHPAVSVSRLEVVLLTLMGILLCVIVLVLHPQAAALQAEAFAVKDEQARKAAFEAFFRLHMPVRSLYMINMGLGIALLAMKVTRLVSRRESQV
ncbi:conserved membrane protein of unknown function [Nitrospira japonica]|uniref:TMEM205-like domain-containing protein n=1 Tax=Nitrospira japonica TaxID=1325564 RepID=A0A1W1IAY7_9BACT|nr:DUF4149 domain-containing protein [Nitrospira japonica]SLM50160.1 conserved membrane protein of unknown function [Nitrospira japonica]